MLDMYLYRYKKGDTSSRTEVACWRKANQIRRWFVENLDGFVDNGETEVPREKLVELLAVCKAVFDSHITAIAKKLLPTSEGPFFGSTAYDKYYYQAVGYTIDRLTNILQRDDSDYYCIVYREWY